MNWILSSKAKHFIEKNTIDQLNLEIGHAFFFKDKVILS